MGTSVPAFQALRRSCECKTSPRQVRSVRQDDGLRASDHEAAVSPNEEVVLALKRPVAVPPIAVELRRGAVDDGYQEIGAHHRVSVYDRGSVRAPPTVGLAPLPKNLRGTRARDRQGARHPIGHDVLEKRAEPGVGEELPTGGLPNTDQGPAVGFLGPRFADHHPRDRRDSAGWYVGDPLTPSVQPTVLGQVAELEGQGARGETVDGKGVIRPDADTARGADGADTKEVPVGVQGSARASGAD